MLSIHFNFFPDIVLAPQNVSCWTQQCRLLVDENMRHNRFLCFSFHIAITEQNRFYFIYLFLPIWVKYPIGLRVNKRVLFGKKMLMQNRNF